jgi:hypothetical protein
MPEVLERLERPSPLSPIYEEFNMSPAKYPHNSFAGKIYSRLDRLLENTPLIPQFDTFRYLEDWLINAFGDFKNAMKLEDFVAGLRRFGASNAFIQRKLDEYTGVGTIYPGYAPDVFVVEEAERSNEFGIPLVVFEVISTQSRNNDLHFKPYFYETIGVREFFVGEPTGETAGTIIRAYRLENNIYQPIPLENDGYLSEVIGHSIPRVWKI